MLSLDALSLMGRFLDTRVIVPGPRCVHARKLDDEYPRGPPALPVGSFADLDVTRPRNDLATTRH
jgi:hypothetical protein